MSNDCSTNECAICLELLDLDISNNVIIQLDCCNKEIHLNCLKNWLINPNNKTKNICILCREESELINDIQNNLLNIPLLNNSHNIEIYDTSDDINNINTINLLYKKIAIGIFISSIFMFSFSLIIFTLLYQ